MDDGDQDRDFVVRQSGFIGRDGHRAVRRGFQIYPTGGKPGVAGLPVFALFLLNRSRHQLLLHSSHHE